MRGTSTVCCKIVSFTICSTALCFNVDKCVAAAECDASGDQDETIVDYVKHKVAGAFGAAEDTSESAAAQAAAAKEAVHKCDFNCNSSTVVRAT